MKAFRNHRGDSFPFSVFHETLYFATFLPPLRYEEWARDGMSYEDYGAVASDIEQRFLVRRPLLRRTFARESGMRAAPRRNRPQILY